MTTKLCELQHKRDTVLKSIEMILLEEQNVMKMFRLY